MITRAVFAAAAVAALVVPIPSTAAAASTDRADSVTVSVQNVTPAIPVESTRHLPLTVTLTLSNHTAGPVKVAVTAERGAPIGNQAALDNELGRSAPATGSGLAVKANRPVTVTLPAGSGDIETAFSTTTSVLDDGKGICLCHNAVYPLYFRAVQTGLSGPDKVLGSTTTFLPSFDKRPRPVKVAWVWPLIDRPHRLVSDTVFTDDDLSESVGDAGRLDRALAVVEHVGRDMPVTLIVDPELLDELQIMSTRQYTVRTTSGKTVAGRGRSAAVAWLARLQAVLADHAAIQVAVTPYADPDVQSLSADGLGWSSILPREMSARVSLALGGRPFVADVAWPVATAIDSTTLNTLRASGTRDVILGSDAVGSSSGDGGIPPSAARLNTASGSVAATLTSPATRTYVGSAVSIGGTGTADLPHLTAEIAIRAAQLPDSSHLVLLTPPRYVDASPTTAAAVIRETSSSSLTVPVALRSAITAELPDQAGRLRSVPDNATRLPASISSNARNISDNLSTVNSMLQNSSNAATLLAALPRAVQRVESSAWRVDSTIGGKTLGEDRSRALSAEVRSIRTGVRIVRPSSGSYTLASGDSPLPITVRNDLNYAVEIDVVVRAVDNLPGFTADRKQNRIAAQSRQTISVPTQVQRSGKIQVVAQLRTSTDAPLGDAVSLSVHSTVLGLVGVIITAVAGAVLVIALLVRAVARIRRRRRIGPDRGPVPSPDLATQPGMTAP